MCVAFPGITSLRYEYESNRIPAESERPVFFFKRKQKMPEKKPIWVPRSWDLNLQLLTVQEPHAELRNLSDRVLTHGHPLTPYR
jgi:hypothetical protein